MAPYGLNTAHSAGVQGKVTLNTTTQSWLLKNPAKTSDPAQTSPLQPQQSHLQTAVLCTFSLASQAVLLLLITLFSCAAF